MIQAGLRAGLPVFNSNRFKQPCRGFGQGERNKSPGFVAHDLCIRAEQYLERVGKGKKLEWYDGHDSDFEPDVDSDDEDDEHDEILDSGPGPGLAPPLNDPHDGDTSISETRITIDEIFELYEREESRAPPAAVPSRLTAEAIPPLRVVSPCLASAVLILSNLL